MLNVLCGICIVMYYVALMSVFLNGERDLQIEVCYKVSPVKDLRTLLPSRSTVALR